MSYVTSSCDDLEKKAFHHGICLSVDDECVREEIEYK